MEANSSRHSFSVGQAVSYGWETTKKNLKFLVFTVLIYGAITWGLSFLHQSIVGQHPQGMESFVGFILQIISQVVSLILTMGLLRITLSIVEGKRPAYSYLWDNWNKKLWNLFLAELIFGIAIIIGFILLIIPGIIIALKFQFFGYFIIDKNMGPIEALKASNKITKGNLWKLFLVGLTEIGIIILGALLLVIGLLVAYPVVMLMTAYIYRKLSGASVSSPKEITA